MTNEDIVREHQEIKDLAKSNKHRIDELEQEQKELRNLTEAVTTMANEQKHIREDLNNISSDVKSIKEKPGKRFDAIAEKVLLLIVAAVVAYMLKQIGL